MVTLDEIDIWGVSDFDETKRFSRGRLTNDFHSVSTPWLVSHGHRLTLDGPFAPALLVAFGLNQKVRCHDLCLPGTTGNTLLAGASVACLRAKSKRLAAGSEPLSGSGSQKSWLDGDAFISCISLAVSGNALAGFHPESGLEIAKPIKQHHDGYTKSCALGLPLLQDVADSKTDMAMFNLISGERGCLSSFVAIIQAKPGASGRKRSATGCKVSATQKSKISKYERRLGVSRQPLKPPGDEGDPQSIDPEPPEPEEDDNRYACPFSKHNPRRYFWVTGHAGCTEIPGLERKRVLEHVKRVHSCIKEKGCRHCGAVWTTPSKPPKEAPNPDYNVDDRLEEHDEHMRHCEGSRNRRSTKPESMSKAQEHAIRNSDTDDGKIASFWSRIYMRLFPEAFSIPSPEYDFLVPYAGVLRFFQASRETLPRSLLIGERTLRDMLTDTSDAVNEIDESLALQSQPENTGEGAEVTPSITNNCLDNGNYFQSPLAYPYHNAQPVAHADWQTHLQSQQRNAEFGSLQWAQQPNQTGYYESQIGERSVVQHDNNISHQEPIQVSPSQTFHAHGWHASVPSYHTYNRDPYDDEDLSHQINPMLGQQPNPQSSDSHLRTPASVQPPRRWNAGGGQYPRRHSNTG